MYRVWRTSSGSFRAQAVGTTSRDQANFFECDNWLHFSSELQWRINNEAEALRQTVTGEVSSKSPFAIPFHDRRRKVAGENDNEQ